MYSFVFSPGGSIVSFFLFFLGWPVSCFLLSACCPRTPNFNVVCSPDRLEPLCALGGHDNIAVGGEGGNSGRLFPTTRVKKSLRIAPTVEAFLACVGAKSKDGQRASRRWICRGIPLSSRHGIIPDWTETQSRMDEQDRQGKETVAAFRARPSKHRMCARTWACAGVVASDVEREARLWYQRSPVHSGRVPYAFRTRAVRVPYAFRWYL